MHNQWQRKYTANNFQLTGAPAEKLFREKDFYFFKKLYSILQISAETCVIKYMKLLFLLKVNFIKFQDQPAILNKYSAFILNALAFLSPYFYICKHKCINEEGVLCDNWKSSFLPLLIFDCRTFLRRVGDDSEQKSSIDQSELEK